MLDLWLLNDGGSPEWGRQVTEERQVGSGGLGVRAWPCLELKACDKAAPLHGQSPPRLESPPYPPPHPGSRAGSLFFTHRCGRWKEVVQGPGTHGGPQGQRDEGHTSAVTCTMTHTHREARAERLRPHSPAEVAGHPAGSEPGQSLANLTPQTPSLELRAQSLRS